MAKLLVEDKVRPQVGWGGASENHQDREKDVRQVDRLRFDTHLCLQVGLG